MVTRVCLWPMVLALGGCAQCRPPPPIGESIRAAARPPPSAWTQRKPPLPPTDAQAGDGKSMGPDAPAGPLNAGEFGPDDWLPILSGEDGGDIYPGYDRIESAGIRSNMYGGRDYVVIVMAKDFNRAREMLLADPSLRRFVTTERQFARWMESHPDLPRPVDEVAELLRQLQTMDGWKAAARELAERTQDTDRVVAAFDAMLRETMKGGRQPFHLSLTGNSPDQCVRDDRCRTRWAIARAIRHMGERAAPLVDLLLDLDLLNEGEVRGFGWGSLVANQIRSKAIPALLRRLESADEISRSHSLTVLRKLERDGAVALPKVREMLKHDPSWNVRMHAVEAAAYAAPEDPIVRADLESAASHDPDEGVRARAKWVVENVLGP
jgi:hypothetical protein